MGNGNKHKKKFINPFLDSGFAKLFNELYSPLYQYCLKLVGNKELAEDIVQEQFVYIWENRERLDRSASIKAYLFTSVKHRSIDHLRKKFFKNKECIENIPDSNLIGELPNPAEILENKELRAIINKALANLPEKCRIILIMKKLGEFTNKEIANKLNISVKTVENQMTIAIKKLIIYISDHWS